MGLVVPSHASKFHVAKSSAPWAFGLINANNTAAARPETILFIALLKPYFQAVGIQMTTKPLGNQVVFSKNSRNFSLLAIGNTEVECESGAPYWRQFRNRPSEGRVTRVPECFRRFRMVGDSCNSSLRSLKSPQSKTQTT